MAARTQTAPKTRTVAKPQVPLYPTRDIPLNQLILSASNVRKIYDEKSIDDFAEDIAQKGLLQSLLLQPCGNADGVELFEVKAGGRRLRALQKLLKQKRIAPDAPIPCMIKPEGVAENDSLTENVMREAMHPLDEFHAFKAMIDKGMSEVDIAAAYRTTPLVVKQRLRLSNASPKLIAAYVADDINLKELMAFCVIDDAARQEDAFARIMQMPEWQRSEHTIRSMLTEKTVRADDRRAIFLGLDAYQAAGGVVIGDLFNEQSEGFLQDPDLLNRLVDEKLALVRDDMVKAGWKWAEAAVDIPYEQKRLPRITPLDVKLSADDKNRLKALEDEREDLENDEDGDADQIHKRIDEIDEAISLLEDPVPTFRKKEMKRAGVFIEIDGDGKLDIDYGFVRAEDMPKAGSQSTDDADAEDDDTSDGEDGVNTSAPEDTVEHGKPLSDALLQDLTEFRTVALQQATMKDYRAAFIAVLHAMCLARFYHSTYHSCFQITSNDVVPSNAPGLDGWAPKKDLDARRAELKALLPENPRDLWDALFFLTKEVSERLFAYCAASTINAVRERHAQRKEQIGHAGKLQHTLGLNMVAAGWIPTAENYLSRVSKTHIIDAVREAKGDDTAHLIEGMKKQGMVMEAERLLAGTGWLPGPLRFPRVLADAPVSEPAALPAFLADPAEPEQPAA
ncbi:ParB/RepB/Spo0J family partition protein [Hyphomicrobium sp. DY-1]|uniref:ParB/RepB/Spo0J family partition protein n=1 Tax=Hyphomicrobium sp. DY-1 TaxID=3075650 RepID=UPI0039C41108